MKLGILVNQAFIASLNDLNAQKLPVAIAYKVSKLVSKAAEEQQEYSKLRKAAIESHAQKDDEGNFKYIERDGNRYYDFGDNQKALEEELQSLDETDVDVPKIKASELVKVPSLSISPAQLNDLSPIINDDL